jgi:hypothetical protein
MIRNLNWITTDVIVRGKKSCNHKNVYENLLKSQSNTPSKFIKKTNVY